jgi:hypothetical protein
LLSAENLFLRKLLAVTNGLIIMSTPAGRRGFF